MAENGEEPKPDAEQPEAAEQPKEEQPEEAGADDKKKDKKGKKDKKNKKDKDEPKDNKAAAAAAAAAAALDPRKYNPLAGSTGTWVSWDQEEKEDNLSECCCCLCVCSNKKTENLTCCLCIPIKAGVSIIGVFTFVLAAWWISVQFFLILNDRVAWWYPVVNLALLIPLYLAASFWVVWFAKDQVSSRVQLQAAVILTIISVSLYAAWTIIYFVWIYKGNTVYYGWGTREAGYLKFQKKYYIFKELLNAAILLVAFTYFLCVVGTYKQAMRKKKPEAAQA